ncbi:hypothetical protein HD806DRAFT_472925 [Xylariaceae sp. AK1471]|nr:hypothetical protein HD806DRAFT_472925 [Xylariaceae sp. AK1471]
MTDCLKRLSRTVGHRCWISLANQSPTGRFHMLILAAGCWNVGWLVIQVADDPFCGLYILYPYVPTRDEHFCPILLLYILITCIYFNTGFDSKELRIARCYLFGALRTLVILGAIIVGSGATFSDMLRN